jgi:hypothetical protein
MEVDGLSRNDISQRRKVMADEQGKERTVVDGLFAIAGALADVASALEGLQGLYNIAESTQHIAEMVDLHAGSLTELTKGDR